MSSETLGSDGSATRLGDAIWGAGGRRSGSDPDDRAGGARSYPGSVQRRLGWMLDEATEEPTDTLHEQIGHVSEVTPLVPAGHDKGAVDRRWGVLVNATVEPDW